MRFACLLSFLAVASGAGAQTLTPDRPGIPVAFGGSQFLFVEGATYHAGKSYVIAGSMTGTTPGAPIGPLLRMPLNVDQWTVLTLINGNGPFFPGFQGVLDAQARATACINLPAQLPISLVGLTLDHAFLLYDASGFLAVSNPASLQLTAGTFDVDAFFRTASIVDGNANYYSPRSLIGRPNFDRDSKGRPVKVATGIDLGCISLSSEAGMNREIANLRNRFTGAMLVKSKADLAAVISSRTYGILFYTQIHFPLQGSVNNIQGWYDKGLRVFQIAYGFGTNQEPGEKLGGGTDETGGLTPLGVKVVDELIRLGMIIDLSHCNAQTTLDVVDIAKQKRVPVTANHVCARAIASYSRNVTNAEIRGIRDTGGVVGVMAYAPFLRRPGNGNIDDFVAHVEHVVRIAGVDHVGVATDGYLDGTMAPVKSDGILDGPSRWKEAARRLKKKGFSDSDLEKVFGLNFLRVYQQVLK